MKYVENPVLSDPNDIYYCGYGCTWDEDLNGNRYRKLYHPEITERYHDDWPEGLKKGDVIPHSKPDVQHLVNNLNRKRLDQQFEKSKKNATSFNPIKWILEAMAIWV